MSQIFKLLKKYIYGFFNGVNSAESLTKAELTDDKLPTSIEKHVETKSLADSLLKGEVSEEVKELRYKNYAVSRESEHYNYIGNGLVVKNDMTIKPHYKNPVYGGYNDIILVQDNSIICNNVYEELERINSYGGERKYILKCERKSPTRFRLEEFVKKIVVKKNKENNVYLHLYVSEYADEYNLILTKGFINEIDKIFNKKISCDSDIFNIEKIWFITQNAYNYDDLFKFEYNNIKFDNIVKFDGSYVIILNANVLVDGEDLVKKYHNKNIEDKYKNKEPKNNTYILNAYEDCNEICDVCGKPMNKYDAQITEATFGKKICINCLAKEEFIKANK